MEWHGATERGGYAMTRGKQRRTGVIWILACLASALAGFCVATLFDDFWQGEEKAETEEMDATIVALPARQFVAVKGGKSQVNIIRRDVDLQHVTGVTVITDGGGRLDATFAKVRGVVRSLSVSDGSKHVREWQLREDGSIESETTFSPDGRQGTQRLFDPEGVCTNTVTLKVHQG
jgi:hypothetical protein